MGDDDKSTDKGGKNVPNDALILTATFVYVCIKLCVEPKHVGTGSFPAEVLPVPDVTKDELCTSEGSVPSTPPALQKRSLSLSETTPSTWARKRFYSSQ